MGEACAAAPRVDDAAAVADRLRQRNISRVAVVDDAFDAASRDEVENEIPAFFEAVAADAAALAFLNEFAGAVIDDETAITSRVIEEMYKSREKLEALQPHFDQHLRQILERNHGALDDFIGHLERDLRLEVRRHGTAAPVDKWAEVVFVDFFLGPHTDEAQAVAASKRAVRTLLEGYEKGTSKPLVVLMSNEPRAKQYSDEFRDDTGIVGGMFFFAPKSDLKDRVKLLLNMDMLAEALPNGHIIQRFVDAITHKDELQSVTDRFAADIKRLNLDDYAFIQRLSLQHDGHPLGDYLLWLFSAYFGHMLFETAMKPERKALDRMSFAQWVPSHAVPSTKLRNMYHAALFDTSVDPLGPHPRALIEGDESVVAGDAAGGQEGGADGAPGAEQPQRGPASGREGDRDGSVGKGGVGKVVDRSTLPYFHLGDIFTKPNSADVYFVTNPECDLEFTPDGKRLLDPTDSILVIPGVLKTLEEAPPEAFRTDLFRRDDNWFRILWFPKRVRTFALGTVADELAKEGWVRVARLRMPFSLELQHTFTSQFSRVGTPVTPPFYRSVTARVYRRDEDDNYQEVQIAAQGEAFLIDVAGDSKCVFTADLIRNLHQLLDTVLVTGAEIAEDVKGEAIEAPRARVVREPGEATRTARAGGKKPQRTKEERLAKAREVQQEADTWRGLWAPFELKAGKVAAFGGAVSVVRSDDISKLKKPNTELLVQIVEGGDAAAEALPEKEGEEAIDAPMEER
jgi:hypothetical protein